MEVRDGKNSLDVADTAVDDAIDMTVTVTNVPEPAGNVAAQVLSAHQIRVTWSAPDSANANYVSHYELAYRELIPKNPSETGPDRFEEWTTLTLDRETRQVDPGGSATTQLLRHRAAFGAEGCGRAGGQRVAEAPYPCGAVRQLLQQTTRLA